jgi:serine/threonine-protein kinase
VIGLLGRGGMGEVYRADDLKLGQPVALKFLPAGLEQDEGRLQRFLNEVRMALKVSHPNVCRVHDIGEIDGQHYISMEYVDGEDLGSLLRRIGRLPKDKAIQAARQICAGLGAAHGQGVLHRDLKPANVMIDGRGQVKITDFGLAGLDHSIEGAEARAGTPAYMAPEQWEGTEVTTKSDLYALGLVLFELFTGERPFKGNTPAEIMQDREQSSPTPSSLVEGFDPAVERVIMSCLENEPAARPSSAMAVAAALPGGDPLAAALAAGETPSPELVAEAGGTEGISPKTSVGLLVSALILMVVWLFLAPQTQFTGYVDLERPPEVLVADARKVLADLGYGEEPRDSVFDFGPNMPYVSDIGRNDSAGDRWERLRRPQPTGMRFRYRQSPRAITRQGSGSIGNWMEDPPLVVAGEALVELDLQGRLLALLVVPPERQMSATDVRPEADWRTLFSALGLDPNLFVEHASTWIPPVYADSRTAWVGTYPDAPEIEVRIEAAAFEGRPVAMRLLEPWNQARSEETVTLEEELGVDVIVRELIFNLTIVIAIFVAWRNLRLGRGDRKTAFRFALYLGVVRLLWMVGAHHVAAPGEANLLFAHYAYSTWRIFMVWIFYMAVEPYARRLWPHVLVTWVRLFDGRWRDPVVGRDVLFGVAAGAFMANFGWLQIWLVPRLANLPGPVPQFDLPTLEALRRGAHLVTGLAIGHTQAVLMNCLFFVLVLVIFRMILRRTWLAIGLLTLIVLSSFGSGYANPFMNAAFIAVIVALFLLVFFRLGFLPFVVMSSTWTVLGFTPITADTSSWLFGGTLVAFAIALGLAVYGFRTSLAGRTIIRDELAEPVAGV